MTAFRLRPIMKQGTAAGIPETWTHYQSVEDARAGAKLDVSQRSRPAGDGRHRQCRILRGMDRAMRPALAVKRSRPPSGRRHDPPRRRLPWPHLVSHPSLPARRLPAVAVYWGRFRSFPAISSSAWSGSRFAESRVRSCFHKIQEPAARSRSAQRASRHFLAEKELERHHVQERRRERQTAACSIPRRRCPRRFRPASTAGSSSCAAP